MKKKDSASTTEEACDGLTVVSYDASQILDESGNVDLGRLQEHDAKIDDICNALGGSESGAGMGYGARDIEFGGLPRSAKGEIEAGLLLQHIKATVWYPDDDDLLDRAIKAYHRRCKREGSVLDQPGRTDSTVEEYGGRLYVILRNVRGVMAAYRVTEKQLKYESVMCPLFA
jgi:hypothetical protein